ncbi:MAG: flavin reductase family protein [Gemmatimonadetes bacterium]|nr:flavin reductase family protein [Gemmatimonadota bacterium]NIQ60014.1 flavin reductase family protein [Gemmatimonadota bacterium]NIU80235.1 flavin reductase family protein [Gammaproteobacteria bacterium]NIX48618.1 flavin reductase family protein [Gemmatimonadota bacterium]NIY13065.1 flavin reductase family protein [Gemmatimonadota bacterium]
MQRDDVRDRGPGELAGPGRGLLRASALSGRQRYRLLTSLIVPRPIGWISTWGADGVRNLAPFSYFNALSAAPMLVGASVGLRRGAVKDTLANVRASGQFAVNLVTERHLEAMVHTAGDWPAGSDEFEEAGLEAADCEAVEAPYVADAIAVLECRLFREIELGAAPNTLIIGEVEAVRLGRELAVDPETLHVDPGSLRPVGRLGLDAYTTLGTVRHVPRPRVG